MYVTHHYGDHDQWLENKRNWNKNKPSNESSNPTDSKPTKTLSLANNMRAVMVATFLMFANPEYLLSLATKRVFFISHILYEIVQ